MPRTLQNTLFLDFETASLLDLGEVGLDRYAKDPSTHVSILAYAVNDGDVQIWLPHLTRIPKKLLETLADPNTMLVAWNAGFERNIFKHTLGLDFPIARWRDPIILAHNLSLPGALESVARILKMKEQKDSRGDDLVAMFCQPVSKGGDMTLFGIRPPLFRDHASHPKEFAEYVEYCRQDVVAERDLWYRLLKIPFPERDWNGWLLDQKINEFGMPGRRDLAEKAYRLAERYIAEQNGVLKQITGLENPNSDDQMKEWLSTRGYSWSSLRKEFVQQELDNPESELTADARKALLVRQTTRKSSYKKLERFLLVLSSDDRLRNQFRYMAAARTGRWAGGDVQVQNLPRGTKAVKKKLALALKLIADEDYEGIKKEFTKPGEKDSVSVVELIITLLRSMFQASPGKKLIVADLNAIENRVLGWAAGCWSILEVFTKPKEDGGDPYLSFGCRLYNKTYAEMWAKYISGDDTDRQNSKPAVLGAGYALGGGEMHKNEYGDMVRGGLWGYAKNVCGVDMPKELAHKAVSIFRESYPEVVKFWADLEEAFKQVLTHGGVINVGEVTWDRQQREWVKHKTCLGCVISFSRIAMADGGYMIRMTLPSSRALHYLNATIESEQKTSKKTGRPYTQYTIFYDGIEHSSTTGADGQQAKKRHKWGRVKTYGGKLCENAVQAIARDLLLNGMLEADAMGFHLWGLFHDELAAEEDDDIFGLSLSDLIECMTIVPVWAPGLLLAAEGFEGRVYRKG